VPVIGVRIELARQAEHRGLHCVAIDFREMSGSVCHAISNCVLAPTQTDYGHGK